MNLILKSFFTAVACVAVMTFTACQQEGTFEKEGKKVDEGVEKSAEKVEKAGEVVAEKVEKAGDVVAEKVEGAAGTLDDTAITAKVKADILADPLLKVLEIAVTTTAGVVQLSGTVSSQEQVDRALEIAGAAKDVKSVENNLVVKAN